MHNPFSKKYRAVLIPEERKKRRNNRITAITIGCLLGISFPPFPTYYFLFVALVPFFYKITKMETLGEINRFTYLTTFVYTIISLHWVGSWTTEADPFLMVAGGMLMFFEPIVFLIPTTIYYFVKKNINKNIALLLFPFFWVTYEYLYSISDFQFPWLTLGHSLAYFTEFIQIADIVGNYGLSLIILYINLSIFLSIKNFSERKICSLYFAIIALLLYVIPLVYGNLSINNFNVKSEKVTVGLLQPDFDPNNRWDGGTLSEQVKTYFTLADSAVSNGAEIIVMPESALPVYLLSERNRKTSDLFHKYCDSNNVSIITGMPDATIYFDKNKAPQDAKPLKNSDAVYVSYNSILSFTPNSEKVEKYGKIKLVPFGEKVPYVEYIPILGDIIKWNVGISSWNTGKDTVVFQVPTSHGKINVGGVVCIESIYSDFTAQFVLKGADFIAVVTNDSWYGNSFGPYQHKAISILRAVENKRSVVRAANGGISCLISPLGKIVSDTKMFTRRSLTVKVPINRTLTYFTKHSTLIPNVAMLISFLSLLLIVVIKIKLKFIKVENSYE